MASAFLFCLVSIFLVFLIIPIPVINSSNIPKTWQDFAQNCTASFASSSAKHCFSNVFYPSGGEHVGDPEAYCYAVESLGPASMRSGLPILSVITSNVEVERWNKPPFDASQYILCPGASPSCVLCVSLWQSPSYYT